MAQFRRWLMPAAPSVQVRTVTRRVLAVAAAGALVGAGVLAPVATAPAAQAASAAAATAATTTAAPATTAAATTAAASASDSDSTSATPLDAAVNNGSTTGGWRGNSTPLVSNGLSRTLRYVVVGKDGKSYATNAATSAVSRLDGGNLTNGSIVDLDQMSSIAFTATFTNTTSADLTFSTTYWLPEAVRLGKNYWGNRDSIPRLVAGTPSVTAADGSTPTGFTVTMGDQPASAANPPGTPTVAPDSRAEVKATLAAGQTVTMTIPLTLENADTLVTAPAGYSMSYARTQEFYLVVNGKAPSATWSAETGVRFAHRLLATDASGESKDWLASGAQYLGATRVDQDGGAVGTHYSVVPQEIQKLLPTVSPSEAYTENIPTGVTWQNYAGPTTHFTARADQDPALYTGGLYYIDTTRIKKALAGTGWSVNNLTHPRYTAHNKAGDVDGLADVYAYQTWGNAQIDGETAAEADDPHVELYQYISTRDVTIHVGEDYDATDAVTDSDTAAANHTLRFLRDYAGATLAVNGTSVTVDDSQVNTHQPGRYPVTYIYTPGYGTASPDTVTATAYVTVVPAPTPEPSQSTDTAQSSAGSAASSAPTASSRPTPSGHLARTGALVLGIVGLAGLLTAAGILLVRRHRA